MLRFAATTASQVLRRGLVQQPLVRSLSITPKLSIPILPVHTNNAPQAVGPYSQAVKWGNLVFVSGVIPIDPKSGKIVEGIENQAEQILLNMKEVLKASNSSPNQVVKTTVFFTNLKDHFGLVNDIYAKHFDSHRPARSAIEVTRLPKDVQIEIECIAETST